MLKKALLNLSYTRIIALSFFSVIFIGSIILSLPLSVKEGADVSFLDALFTATSAVCVTGLVSVDTFSTWTLFGQLVILAMIQIGGIGLMTVIILFFLFMKKKIGLKERMLLMQSAGNTRLSGIVRLIKKIFAITITCESIGAVLLFLGFVKTMPPLQAAYYALFHSVSAFCNAGFDLMGRYSAFSSFTAYESNVLINLSLMFLIVTGGIGFIVWDDIFKNKLRFSDYSLHSKIALCTTAVLLLSGWVLFYVFEYGASLSHLSPAKKIIPSLFLSVTTRTAGFNTVDLASLSESGSLLAMFLMLVGGSPGSTAGGIKTSTIAVIVIAAISLSRGESEVNIFKKRLESDLVKQAAAILLVYLALIFVSTMAICHIEGLNMTDVLFETVSAVATVGLSRGLTPSLSPLSHIILIILMFGGRIGALSLFLIFGERKKAAVTRRPSEKILIG